MKIDGLQKMTLLDYPGRVACTVFLGGCNFRCPFCHNSELLDGSAPAVMTDAELLGYLKKRKGLLDGVCVTGGEPLLHADVGKLLASVKALGYDVKLDTNGAFPDRLRKLVEDGLVDYVAMDVKNCPQRYAETVGLREVDLVPIMQSVSFLLSGAVEYEFRTTVVDELHDEGGFRALAQWLKGAKRYYLQPFTDRDTVLFAGLHAPTAQTLTRYLDIVRPLVPSVALRGE